MILGLITWGGGIELTIVQSSAEKHSQREGVLSV